MSGSLFAGNVSYEGLEVQLTYRHKQLVDIGGGFGARFVIEGTVLVRVLRGLLKRPLESFNIHVLSLT